MLDGLFLLKAMDGVGERELLEAGEMLGWEQPGAAASPLLPRRRIRLGRALLVAALLALLLTACGYLAFQAEMSHREPHPEDENIYFLRGRDIKTAQLFRLDLNFGSCAMTLHFETEERGFAHGFRLGEAAPIESSWIRGSYSLAEKLAIFAPGGPEPTEEQRTLERCLREAGMTSEEAEGWTISETYASGDDPTHLLLRIELMDGPQLHGLDLIVGWPEGEATVLREETEGDVQILEALVEEAYVGDTTRCVKYLFRFDTRRQVLLVLSAAEELDFETLEAIADAVEIRETGFSYARDHSGQNFSVLGFAFG